MHMNIERISKNHSRYFLWLNSYIGLFTPMYLQKYFVYAKPTDF